MNYYNEHDPKAAAWLRELIKAGLIPAGWVDERSIVDVNPYELTQYTQHHFFAGIGGWPLALNLAGWPESKRVVTGSCPCQPFSAAGLGLGEKDERHLWPVFRDILTHLAAPVCFGEQVASKAGRVWLSGVRADLEGLGYAVGAADLCAASACPEMAGWIWIPDETEDAGGFWIPASSGPPHIRQRLYWVANAGRSCSRRAYGSSKSAGAKSLKSSIQPSGLRSIGGLADTYGRQSGNRSIQRSGQHGQQSEDGEACGLEHATRDGWIKRRTESGERSTVGGCWDLYEVTYCTDGKARRFESGSFPLAHGVSDRVGLLRGYGNAINPYIAAEFIQAFEEAIN